VSDKTCVIMQPTYLPWIGYFDLMDQADVFIFLDNVQFSKQSWQQRNRIRTKKGLEWLTIPVKSKGKFGQFINQVTVTRSKIFPQTHLRAIELNYHQTPFYNNYFPGLQEILDGDIHLLNEININIIIWVSKLMGINIQFIRSSDLNIEGKRSDLLVQLCKKLNANQYLSPMGSKEYLVEDLNVFLSQGIKVFLHNYDHPEYNQVYTPFLPYAAIIDLLFNHGERSLEIIRSGRRESTPLSY
jgi:hypothetical protein